MTGPPSIGLFLSEFIRLGYLSNSNGSSSVWAIPNIVGWRSTSYVPDTFSDWIGMYWWGIERWQYRLWPATTRPGTPWLLNPVNPHGTAILVPGQYRDVYALGPYKGYTALKQVRPMRVYRDNNRDSKTDQSPDTIEEGLFGIHIHRAGIWSRLVGVSSAGCQVFQKRADFNEFIALCSKAAVRKFTYTLLEY